MKTLKMALRNIGRNKRRTLVTLGSMAFAAASMIFCASLFEGFMITMERQILGLELGDIQVHARDYRTDPSVYTTIADTPGVLASLDKLGVRATPRVYASALASSGPKSAGVQLRGVDLAREPKVTQIHEQLKEGTWLDVGKPQEIVLGGKLARILGVGLGEEVILLSQATDGSMANDLYKVRGVLKPSGEAIDRVGLFMSDEALRELMVIGPGHSHEIALVRGEPGADLDAEVARIQDALANPELEVVGWKTLRPMVAQMLASSDVSLVVMIILIYTAVGMVILNAMLMSVFERIREFGVMKAIGFSPWTVLGLILTEALCLSALASVLGALVGVPLSWYFQVHGLDLSAFMENIQSQGVTIEPIWYFQVTTGSVMQPVVFLFVITAVAVLYPAWKAAWISPRRGDPPPVTGPGPARWTHHTSEVL